MSDGPKILNVHLYTDVDYGLRAAVDELPEVTVYGMTTDELMANLRAHEAVVAYGPAEIRSPHVGRR